MSRASYSYRTERSTGGSLARRPVLGFRVRTRGDEWLSLSAYLDSGADLSMFPASDLELLGFSDAELEEVTFSTASGDEVRGRMADLRLDIAGTELTAPVMFCEGAVRLLGRAGVFEPFYVVFDEASRQVHLFSRDDPELSRVLG